ncbi:YdcF family protein [Vitiosangium sp. GDMCC 1.1324]|uniref:YdcF family protein n=1 Tax=Vitiosangium sp. (strain GDMCC 1.1324) TaxID=2138576 RepID=UPI000D33A2B7|nr:YdcF family protein [Vitiosangium sp. GDMCC 1.1324]PTL75345.1 YdcF family protein [Vitiosangium sp. GDMCC 1.1324]
MFVFLSKLLDLLLAPLSWGLLLGGAGLLLRRRRARLAAWLQGLGLAVLYVFSTEPVANGLQCWVEAGAVSTYRPDVVYDAVIVLGGAVDADATERSGLPEFTHPVERILRGFELLRDGHARQVLLSAGTLDTRPGALVEADVLARQLRLWGIEPERIVTEGRSRNTRENAVESERIIREKGWKRLVLVTSAAHMPRALGTFEAVGLKPDTLVVDVRAHDWHVRGAWWQPRASNLAAGTDVLRELVGRLVYRLWGWA